MSDDRDQEWQRRELAVQAAALAVRVSQLETMIREVEHRLKTEAEAHERRMEKELLDIQTRIEGVITHATQEFTRCVAARVRIDDFRPYKLLLWILGSAVLAAAVPTLSDTFLPAIVKAVFR